jgi:hypothetical protein
MYCDKDENVCLSVDIDKWKLTKYISIIFILLFFIHIFYTVYYCKKFSTDCFAILIISITIITSYVIIQNLRAKIVDIIDENKNNYDNYKKGDYWVNSNNDRFDLYCILLGNIIFLFVLFYYMLKKQITFGCPANFKWSMLTIPFSFYVFLVLKYLIKN